MKTLLFVLSLFIVNLSSGQDLPFIKPTLQGANIYSKVEQQKWQKGIEHLEQANAGKLDYQKLTEKEKEVIDALEMLEGPMTQSVGCSWYCGGGPYKVTGSSSLESNGAIHYEPENIHDFNLLTAWVPKKGIGSKINFHFRPYSARVNELLIWNGYIKNIDLWKANARVAKFKLYINDVPTAILVLEDVTDTQHFPIAPIQSTDSTQDLVLTLEIIEVYKGDKYEDVAIGEINFNGLDVHCFGAGTEILLADGTAQNIETIRKGNWVMSYDYAQQRFIKSEVSKLVIARHSKLTEIRLEDRNITVTTDHPFWTKEKSWAAINPEKANANYEQTSKVNLLTIGDKIFLPNEQKFITVLEVMELNVEQLTYTLELVNGDSFIANGLLVKTESPFLFESSVKE